MHGKRTIFNRQKWTRIIFQKLGIKSHSRKYKSNPNSIYSTADLLSFIRLHRYSLLYILYLRLPTPPNLILPHRHHQLSNNFQFFQLKNSAHISTLEQVNIYDKMIAQIRAQIELYQHSHWTNAYFRSLCICGDDFHINLLLLRLYVFYTYARSYFVCKCLHMYYISIQQSERESNIKSSEQFSLFEFYRSVEYKTTVHFQHCDCFGNVLEYRDL